MITNMTNNDYKKKYKTLESKIKIEIFALIQTICIRNEYAPI